MIERIGAAPLSIADPADSAWFTGDEVFEQAAGDGGAPVIGKSRWPSQVSGRPERTNHASIQRGNEELIVVTLYDESAYRHIRSRRLFDRVELERLRRSQRAIGGASGPPPGSAFPGFPQGSTILLTAWWPVAKGGLTALPVWDPELNPPNPQGNGYLTWKRVVAVDSGPSVGDRGAAQVSLVGRPRQAARRVPLASLLHVAVDEPLARNLMRDERSRKAALIALGRELRPGDWLAMVAVHVVGKKDVGWAWATLWWHDSPDVGPFAAGRPASLHNALRSYLLDVAYPVQAGRAGGTVERSCFNPWLEARFPDGGSGGGLASDCIDCHRRASYPPVSFLPIRRGTPDAQGDPATDPSQLQTDFIWSVARRAAGPDRPQQQRSGP